MTTILEGLVQRDRSEADVYDKTYDAPGVAWVRPDPDTPRKATRYEDATFLLLASSIPIAKVGVGPYGGLYFFADIGGFVEQHYDAFREFSRDCRLSMTGANHDDDIMIGINTIGSLVTGGFNEKEYAQFLKLMGVRPGKVRSSNRRARKGRCRDGLRSRCEDRAPFHQGRGRKLRGRGRARHRGHDLGVDGRLRAHGPRRYAGRRRGYLVLGR